MAASAKVDGQEKVIAAAQQIVKSLATSKNAAEDMIRILSGFDNRFSTIHNDNLFPTSDDPLASAAIIYADDNDFSFDNEDEEEKGSLPGPPSDVAAEARLVDAESVVFRWDATVSLLCDTPSSDSAEEYFAAVDELIALTASPAVVGPLHGRAETALQMAMSRFEEEFRHLMARNAVPLDSNGLSCSIRRLSLSSDCGEPVEDFEVGSVDEEHQQAEKQPEHLRQDASSLEERQGGSLIDEQNIELVNPDAVANLRAIADRMIWSGYDRELHQVFCAVRVDILEESLSILGVERTSIEEVLKTDWKMLDDKMKRWIHAVKIVVRILLLGERRLCDQILGASEELKEACFAEMAKGCIMQLLNFVDAIAICQRSSEKLFRILDMYEALADVLPDMHELFSAKMKDVILEEADGNLKRLGDAVRGILMEFENAIRYESSRKLMLAGEIHPLTRYVMNYVVLLVVYNYSLDLLFKDDEAGFGNHGHARGHGSENGDGEQLGSMTPLGRRLYVLISYLESNLEEKSKVYEDGALQYIFLMNNIFYIVHKVKDSELGRLLGEQWIRRRRSRIRQYATSYLRTSWTKVLSCLKDDGMSGHGSGSGSFRGVSKVALKERFKNFNLAFEEIYKVQTAWKVPDPQLREELRISISEKVIPAYRSFTGRLSGQLEGRNASKHIKYTADDLESYLSELFEGVPAMTNHSRRKT